MPTEKDTNDTTSGGTTVAVYDFNGQQVGTAVSTGGQATVSTSLTTGTAAIVKMGERSVKTVMK